MALLSWKVTCASTHIFVRTGILRVQSKTRGCLDLQKLRVSFAMSHINARSPRKQYAAINPLHFFYLFNDPTAASKQIWQKHLC